MNQLMCLPKRDPICIDIPTVACEVPNCDLPRKFDMVALFLEFPRLDVFQVCGFHMFIWKGFTPTNFFPLNRAPAFEWMVHKVNQEIARRRPPAQVFHQNVFNMNYNRVGYTYVCWE